MHLSLSVKKIKPRSVALRQYENAQFQSGGPDLGTCEAATSTNELTTMSSARVHAGAYGQMVMHRNAWQAGQAGHLQYDCLTPTSHGVVPPVPGFDAADLLSKPLVRVGSTALGQHGATGSLPQGAPRSCAGRTSM